MRCVCAPPPVSSLPSPPKESSLPPSAGSAGLSFYITCTRAGSWAAWGGRGVRGGTRGDEGAPPLRAPASAAPPPAAAISPGRGGPGDCECPGRRGGGENTAPSGPLRKG